MKYLRYLFFVTLFFSSGSIAQPPADGRTVSKEFAVSEIPEKWKNESAVIIAQKTEYQFNRVASGRRYTTFIKINEFIHKRIKLQDKNSLDEFSTFFYVTMGKDGTAEYQVSKPNGKTLSIDMKSAIEEESDIPSIYKPIYYRLGIKYFKIAIPDLEIGDIIDYNVRSTIDWDMKESGIAFTPFIFSLSNKYPTMHQEYRFVMVDGMKVRFRAFNGASNLKLDTKASIFGESQSFVAYYLMDKDREKSIEERWNYDLRNTPSVKFRVIMLADNDPESKALGMASVDRSFLDFDDMYNQFVGAALYRTTTVNSLVAYTTQYISKKKEENVLKNDGDIVREAYYCLRKVFLEIYYKGPVHSELEKYMTGKKLYKKVLKAEKKDETQKEEKEDEIRINSVIFATAFRMALAAQGIQAELYVYLPRSLGTWRDALFLEELDFVMKVRLKNKNYFLEAFTNFDAFATPYSYLEGVEGYSIGYDEKNKYYRTPGPSTSFLENVDKEEHTISFPSSMETVNVERISSLSGLEKSSKVGIANLDRNYLSKDFAKYYAPPEPKGKKKKDEEVIDMESTTGYNDPDKDERVKERKELFEKDLKAEFDLDKYEDFELLNDGRFGDTAVLQFREKYSVKKLLSRAGKNYVFEIGKFLGGQIKLEQRELETRQSDIWLPNARTIENIIILNLPAGYTADGLKELEMNIDNESGSFISSVKTEGSKVTVTTWKIYKKNFDKKELWPNYVAFLEAAYKFSQLRVVLKKT
ncbi:MAG TPA: hypothetical protein VLJ68_11385 [Chitinophagaceae bacterium]|nr:hypothetical protein [Chitinophagaceae bacterium]